jgi:predicted hotdog family 3-hydroxylacyl-ACP dehydratase
MGADLPPPLAAALLAHGGVARLLTEVLRSSPDFVEAVGRVPVAHPLVTAGRAPSLLGLELGAQAAAALEALQGVAAGASGRPRVGYLVRVREASFLRADLPVDAPLGVTARLSGAAGALASYRIAVDFEGVEALRATLSVYKGTSLGPSIHGGLS